MPKSNLQPLSPRWYALYTRGRHEKSIDAELKKSRIESFLPLRKIKRRWSDRTVFIEEPLFKSYLFVKTDLLQISTVLRAQGAVRFVGSQGRPVVVEDDVITSLKTILLNEMNVDPFPYLAAGDRVYVRSGVFKGVEGYVVRKLDKKCRLIISITAIMASVSVEIDACLIEKI